MSRSIWQEDDGWSVGILDQTQLPHAVVPVSLRTLEDAARAIETMQTRGAPMIGACAAYGVALGMRESATDEALLEACTRLLRTRPTAVNLRWALEGIRAHLWPLAPQERVAAAYRWAAALCEEDVETCRRIGEHGLGLVLEVWEREKRPVQILTHCNAGSLACVEWGTATAPIYLAHMRGIPVHVWVEETRPRVQGALTAFELGGRGVSHTVITDNAGGHVIQRGLVDMVMVGTDRVARNGDVANKIGTYMKALVAQAHGVPFYVALPGSTIDWSLGEGSDIPIEERSSREVTHVVGRLPDGQLGEVEIFPPGSGVFNPGFDVTPGALVSKLITERGVCVASEEGLKALYPEEGLRAS